jgi:hypothetical protein
MSAAGEAGRRCVALSGPWAALDGGARRLDTGPTTHKGSGSVPPAAVEAPRVHGSGFTVR